MGIHRVKKSYIYQEGNSVRFRVRVQPGSSKQEVTGVSDGVLRLRLTAPPIDGAANEACRKFLAGLLGLPPSRVAIVGGQKARLKLVQVEGLSPEILQKTLEALGSSSLKD